MTNNDMKKKSFVIYEDWMNIIMSLPDAEAIDLVRTLFSYCLGKDYDGSPVSKGLLATMTPTIDTDVEKYNKRRQANIDNIKKRWQKSYDGIQSNTMVYDGIRPNTNGIESNTKSVYVDVNKDVDVDIDGDVYINNNALSSKGHKKKDDKSSQKENRIPKEDLDEIIARWNTLPEPVPKLTVLKSGTKRYESLAARISEYGIDNVMIAIEKVRTSSFLCGKSSYWHISFDWFVLPNNFPKVLDGNYTDGAGANGNQTINRTNSVVDTWLQGIEKGVYK